MITTNPEVINHIKTEFSNRQLEEVNKILSITKNNSKAAKEYIIRNKEYTNDDKVAYSNIVELLIGLNVSSKIKTTNYDGKTYSLLFISDFLAFIKDPKNNFTFREFKVLISIYEMISEANSISNCLICCSKKYLAEKAGVNKASMGLIFKSLQKKGILKIDIHGSILLNYAYFFMGNSMNYDLYKIQYDNLASKEK